MDTVVVCINFLSSGVILVFSLCELNGMGHRSRHLLRLAFIFMAVGAFGILSAPATEGADARIAYSAVVLGLSLYLVAHRWHEAVRLLRKWWIAFSSFPVNR